MPTSNRFAYQSLAEVRRDAEELHVADTLRFSEDISVLHTPLTLPNGATLPNRFVVHPMEGFDSLPNGAPGELAFRRYRRYAEGGFGLIWFEATAVLFEARSNPCQLWLNDDNWTVFRDLVAATKKAGRDAHGVEPMMVIQLTHSGRYSRPLGYPQPLIAHHSRFLDPIHHLTPDYPLVSDEYLDQLQRHFVHAAQLAEKAGFDGIDLKGCHRYLMAELLASYTRTNSRYGGEALENRSRLMRETLAAIRRETSRIFVTTRMNATDEMPYPYGFGMAHDGSMNVDLTETLDYIRQLRQFDMPFINVTIANPYYQPFYGRPFDIPVIGTPASPEHPMTGVARFLAIVAQVQRANPGFPIIATGYTWLRQFAPNAAAASILNGEASLVGFGRGSFAYPDMPADLARNGHLTPSKCCITCSRCTQIMRDGAHTGCVIRDAATYKTPYDLSRQFATGKAAVAEFLVANATPAFPADTDAAHATAFLKTYAKGDLREAVRMLRQGFAKGCDQTCAADGTPAPQPVRDAADTLARYADMCQLEG